MESPPAAPCERIPSPDLRSTAAVNIDELAEKPHSDTVSNSTADALQPMDTDPVPPSERTKPSDSSATAPINSEKRKREGESPEEVALNQENKKQNSDSNSSSNPLWKTSLCSYYRRHGAGCSHGAACRYAHGEAELRPRPDNTWDPTSNRAKEMGKSEEKKEETEIEDDEEVTLDDSSLEKCFVGLPRKWASDALKKFLEEKVHFLQMICITLFLFP